MKVTIAGVGGIGSNVAVHLVRAGCRSLKLIDFDRVEVSNLNRQYYFMDQVGHYKVDMLRENLLRIAPQTTIESAIIRLTAENMLEICGDCQVLVEGFDEQETKKLLVETFADMKLPIVSASGIAGTKIDTIRSHKLGNCTIVGDLQSDFRSNELYGPKVSVIAAMMADVVLQSSSEKYGKNGKNE